MKILIIFFIFIISTNSFAEEPEYSNNVNENVIKYYWSIDDTKVVSGDKFVSEIITLKQGADNSYDDWILKCIIFYYYDEYPRTSCSMP